MPDGLVQGDRNSQLTVGYKGDRSYVVRGNNIGVFNHSPGSNVKYYATISKIATPKGKEFKPKNVGLAARFIVRVLTLYIGYVTRPGHKDGPYEFISAAFPL